MRDRSSDAACKRPSMGSMLSTRAHHPTENMYRRDKNAHSLLTPGQLPDVVLENVLEQLLVSVCTPEELTDVIVSCKAFTQAWKHFRASGIHARSLSRWVLLQKGHGVAGENPENAAKRLLSTGVHCIAPVLELLPSVAANEVAADLKSKCTRR